LKEVEKKKKKTFSTLSLPLIITHIGTSHFYLSSEKNTKILEEEAKKEKRKGEEILKFL